MPPISASAVTHWWTSETAGWPLSSVSELLSLPVPVRSDVCAQLARSCVCGLEWRLDDMSADSPHSAQGPGSHCSCANAATGLEFTERC